MSLFEKIEKSDLEEVKKLIISGEDINQTHKNGYTPLMYASSLGHKEICIFLLETGANKEIKENNKKAHDIAKEGGHDEIAIKIITYDHEKQQKFISIKLI
jgi:uncharacterized protein